MQTLTKFNGTQSDGYEFSVDDVALKAEQPSRLLLLMAMVCMHLHGVGKFALAYGTSIVLSLTHLLNEFGRKASAQKPTVVVSVLAQTWNGAQSLLLSLLCACLSLGRLMIGVALGNGLWAHVLHALTRSRFRSRSEPIYSRSISVDLLGREIRDASKRQHALTLIPVVAALIFAVLGPLLGCAFTLFHALILSHRQIVRNARTSGKLGFYRLSGFQAIAI